MGTLNELVTINSGGTLAAGNSVGTLTIPGNLVENAGLFTKLEMNGTTNDMYIVGGTAAIDGTVNLITDEVINFNEKRVFLTSTGSLTGTYGSINTSGLKEGFNPALYTATITYDPNHAYITLQAALTSAVIASNGDANARAVAGQLDNIANPTSLQNELLSDFLAFPTVDALNLALDQSSGAQYALDPFVAEVANRQFLRRLYDPIRSLVTADSECCTPANSCGEFLGCDTWASVSGGQARVNSQTYGMKLNEWDATLGLQKTFSDEWTFGVAGSYEHDTIDYDLSGTGNAHTWLGGLYGLYRPSCYYVLADIAYSYTKNKTKRSVVFTDSRDQLRGKSNMSQVTFYAEAGKDFNYNSYLIQPFVGVEVAGYDRKSVQETEVTPSGLGLFIHKKERTATTSSLGVHFTDQYCLGLNISMDLAWLYRFTDDRNFVANFQTFGTDFTVHGPNIGRNSGEGAITFSKEFCGNWNFYVEGSGQVWSHASSYNILSGVQANW